MPNCPVLDFHVPEPATRPGDAPLFSAADLPQPGETRRPDPLDREAGLRDLPFGLIRVLDGQGRAVGP